MDIPDSTPDIPFHSFSVVKGDQIPENTKYLHQNIMCFKQESKYYAIIVYEGNLYRGYNTWR